MPETTPLIKAALNLRGGAGFDVYEKLEKAYEFMKKFVIEGKSVLDKFLEWIGEKVREGRER